jgi:hypothetical protein
MNPNTTPRNTMLIRVARRIAAIHTEISYAQQRLDAIRTNPDVYLTDGGDKMPETYAEFLFRTSGVLVREPVAARTASSSSEVHG